MTPARLARGLYKTLKWLFLATLILILIAAGALYYLLGSDSGYRQLPDLIARFTPYTLEYDTLDGHLLGDQRWQNLHLHGAGLDIRAAELRLNLRARDLLSGDVNIDALHLRDAQILLPPASDEPDTPHDSAPPEKLPDLDLPVNLALHNLTLENIELRQGDKPLINIHSAQLDADYRDSQLKLQGKLDSDKGKATLDGKAETRGDYPLTLALDADTPLLPPGQSAQLRWQQSLLKPQLQLTLTGAVSGDIRLDGALAPAQKHLDATLAWKNLDYHNHEYQSERGSLKLSGDYSALRGELQAAFAGKDLPPAELNLAGDYGDAKLQNIDLTLATLGGSARYQGEADLSGAPAWRGTLDISGINGKNWRPDLDLQLDGHIQTHGGDGNAYLGIERLSGHWQKQPLNGQGSLNYGAGKLDVRDLKLQLAGNSLHANGSADAASADLQLHIAAPTLDRLLPIIGGDINGDVRVSGNLLQPQLDGKLTWKNLRVGDTKNPIVASRQGSATGKGAYNRLAVTIEGDARGEHFPALTLKGSGTLDPLHNIRDIKLDAQSLQGSLHLTGESGWSPHVSWNAKIDAKNLHPHQWERLKTLEGEISARLASAGSVKNGKVQLTADINDLKGRWQKQALAGHGQMKMDGGQYHIKALEIKIGDNRVALDGKLDDKTLALDFDLDGKRLAAFHPALGGSLTGKGKLTGSRQAPELQAQLSGKALTYAGHKIASLQADLATSLKKGGRFNNRIQLQGVQTAGQNWKDIQLASDGNYDRHSLTLRTSGGDANLQLAASGGFSAPDAWKGDINSLEASGYDMQWRLKQRSALQIAPKQITLRDFCLADAHSGLCLDLKRDKQTELAYRISTLDPKSFGKLIPKNIRLNTALQGEGKITIADSGQLRGNADLHLTPGNINIQIKGQPPLNLAIKTAQLRTRFTDRQAENTLAIDLGDSGSINGRALISDLNKQTLSGEIKVNIPDIGKYRNFVPKASEMRGHVGGVLQFSGSAKAPVVSGELQLENGLIKIPQYATELKNIRLRLSAHRSGQIDINGNIGTPDGNLDAKGVLYLAPTRLDLALVGKNMLIADSKTMMVSISPDFRITIDPTSGIEVKGKIHVPKANISIPDTSGGVEISKDVVILNEENPKKPLAAVEPPVPLKADIEILLGDKVYFKNKDVNIRLKGGMTIIERPNRPLAAKGTIEVASGVYELYGQELDIKRGKVTFTGGNIANPTIDFLALRTIDRKDIKVGAAITGSVERLQLKLTSTPKLPDSAILSYLLFGRPPDGTMDNEALLQSAASLSLGGILPGGGKLDALGKDSGLDVFDLGVTGLKAGKYLGKDMYVGLKSNFFTGVTEFIARYQFTEHLNIEASAQAQERAVDLIYEFERD